MSLVSFHSFHLSVITSAPFQHPRVSPVTYFSLLLLSFLIPNLHSSLVTSLTTLAATPHRASVHRRWNATRLLFSSNTSSGLCLVCVFFLSELKQNTHKQDRKDRGRLCGHTFRGFSDALFVGHWQNKQILLRMEVDMKQIVCVKDIYAKFKNNPNKLCLKRLKIPTR